jgi:hypothetical protein
MFSFGRDRTVHLTQSSARTGIENNWFALTGRVVAVKVEADGDLHIALADAPPFGRLCNQQRNLSPQSSTAAHVML